MNHRVSGSFPGLGIIPPSPVTLVLQRPHSHIKISLENKGWFIPATDLSNITLQWRVEGMETDTVNQEIPACDSLGILKAV